MGRENFLSGELDIAGMKAQYDEHVKRILGSKQVLARILQGTAEEYREYSAEQIMEWIEPDIRIGEIPVRPGGRKRQDQLITGENTESKVPGEGVITYDIRFHCLVSVEETNRRNGKQREQGERREQVRLLVDLEAQKDFHQKYHLVSRGIFYGARMLSEQLGREFSDSEYDGMKKVYSIFICMNAPERIGNALSRFRIVKEDLVGKVSTKISLYDKMTIVMIYLNEKTAGEETRGKLHGFLNTLLSSTLKPQEKKRILERDYGMVMVRELGEELNEMCNLSDLIEEKALREGKREGKREGRREGKREGKREGRRVGRREGERKGRRLERTNFSKLTEKLVAESRSEDVIRAARDEAYCETLYRKYGII